ncbi:hypothetical protein RISK_002565 [Rhodopirellula islandica]|uniref:Uncharacterized protein n=1 Tax=Rhodopirellula islandica TaxID=595434 RepID=A0A0J1BFI9_RHOIS|nr:hypothetical protein RISK_002565 [Rhodopirellula islandica]
MGQSFPIPPKCTPIRQATKREGDDQRQAKRTLKSAHDLSDWQASWRNGVDA